MTMLTNIILPLQLEEKDKDRLSKCNKEVYKLLKIHFKNHNRRSKFNFLKIF